MLFIITILLTSLSLLSCGKDNKSDFQKLVKSIYDSEEIIAGYTENSIIKDKDLEVYNKTTEFKIARGKQIKSEVIRNNPYYLFPGNHYTFSVGIFISSNQGIA